LENIMKVSDVMTRRVISVSPETSVFVAIQLMLKHHVSGLPVIDNHGKLVGILSEGDLLRRGEIETERKRSLWLDALFGPADGAADYVHSHGLAVMEVMTRDPMTVTENTRLDEVVRLMENRKVKRLPVLRDGKVIGIVSRANLMRAVLSIYRTTPQSSDNDAAIREHVLAEVRRHDWSSGATVDVVVHGGMVDLWGTVGDLAQREALKVLAENVPGVVRVEDHLTLKDQFVRDRPGRLKSLRVGQ
jgi:CBS domain-containing protein